MADRVALLFTALILLSLIYVSFSKIPDKVACVDPECKTRISKGRATLSYNGNEPGMVSFKRGDEIEVFSKECDKREGMWFIKANDLYGFVPSNFVRESAVESKGPYTCVPHQTNSDASKVHPDSISPTAASSSPQLSLDEQATKVEKNENAVVTNEASLQTPRLNEESVEPKVLSGQDGPSLPTQKSDEVKLHFDATASPKFEQPPSSVQPAIVSGNVDKRAEDLNQPEDDTITRGNKVYLKTNNQEIFIDEVTPSPVLQAATAPSANAEFTASDSVANSVSPDAGITTSNVKDIPKIPKDFVPVDSQAAEFSSNFQQMNADNIQSSVPSPPQSEHAQTAEIPISSSINEASENQGTQTPVSTPSQNDQKQTMEVSASLSNPTIHDQPEATSKVPDFVPKDPESIKAQVNEFSAAATEATEDSKTNMVKESSGDQPMILDKAETEVDPSRNSWKMESLNSNEPSDSGGDDAEEAFVSNDDEDGEVHEDTGDEGDKPEESEESGKNNSADLKNSESGGWLNRIKNAILGSGSEDTNENESNTMEASEDANSASIESSMPTETKSVEINENTNSVSVGDERTSPLINTESVMTTQMPDQQTVPADQSESSKSQLTPDLHSRKDSEHPPETFVSNNMDPNTDTNKIDGGDGSTNVTVEKSESSILIETVNTPENPEGSETKAEVPESNSVLPTEPVSDLSKASDKTEVNVSVSEEGMNSVANSPDRPDSKTLENAEQLSDSGPNSGVNPTETVSTKTSSDLPESADKNEMNAGASEDVTKGVTNSPDGLDSETMKNVEQLSDSRQNNGLNPTETTSAKPSSDLSESSDKNEMDVGASAEGMSGEINSTYQRYSKSSEDVNPDSVENNVAKQTEEPLKEKLTSESVTQANEFTNNGDSRDTFEKVSESSQVDSKVTEEPNNANISPGSTENIDKPEPNAEVNKPSGLRNLVFWNRDTPSTEPPEDKSTNQPEETVQMLSVEKNETSESNSVTDTNNVTEATVLNEDKTNSDNEYPEMNPGKRPDFLASDADTKTEQSIDSENIQRTVTKIADENVSPPSVDTKEESAVDKEKEEPYPGMETKSSYVDSIKPSVQVIVDILPEWMQASAGNLDSQGISSRVIIITIISGVLVLFLLIAIYAAKTRSAEFSLAVKLCHLDQKLFSMTTERNIMRDELECAKEKITHLEQNLIESRRSVSPLQEELGQAKQTCVEQTATISSLEEELSSATEAGLELNKMLSDFLTSQNQNDSLQGSIEALQEQLNSQRENMSALHKDLNVRSNENKEMKAELEILNEKNKTLVIETKQFVKDLEHAQEANLALKEKLEDKTKIFDAMEVENTSFKVQLEDNENQIHCFTDEVKGLKNTLESLKKMKAERDEEISTLKEAMKNMEVDVGDNKDMSSEEREELMQKLLDVTKIKASLKAMTEEKELLSIKYKTEIDAHKEQEAQVLSMKGEYMNMERNMKQAIEDKQEAVTKLEILSKYFKDKEAQLQKELGLQEAIVLQSTETAENAGQKAAEVQQNINLYKNQYETLKKEMDEMERSYKNQIAVQEKKAHENWLAARAAERKLDDMKTESGILRNKLTLVEQEKASLVSSMQNDSLVKPHPQRNPGQNGDLYASHGSASESALTAPSPLSQNSTSEFSGLDSPRGRFVPLDRPGLPPMPFPPPMGMPPMFDERGPLPPLGMPPMMPMMPPFDNRSPPSFERRSHGRMSPDRPNRSTSPGRDRDRMSPYSDRDQYSSRDRISPASDRDRRNSSLRGRSPPRDRTPPYSDRDRRPRSPNFSRNDRSPERYDRDRSPSSYRNNRDPRYSPRYDQTGSSERRFSPPPPRNREPPYSSTPTTLPAGHPLKPPPMVQRDLHEKLGINEPRTSSPRDPSTRPQSNPRNSNV